ncbi:lysine transporter LysE [Azorhizobium oxalatiphilum]|uniref:Lysine transporter LysE n=1 Tax=Azorhizobium oxalatiphilum TaxID=980631 RepID=A0A917BMP4_9HYPH|nr:LysE family translocator [Azorhizobium oxalatiphilum]GGF49775.1 lysine transporter LysE [Azorhizobium oxalatiphilum]
MDFASLALFAAVLTVAAATPGPAVVALVTRTLAGGRTGALPFICGLILGDVLWLAAAVLGLSALAAALGGLFVFVRLAGAAYLLYLAWRLWTAPTGPVSLDAQPRRSGARGLFGAGVALTIGNPKTMAFYLAALPAMMDLEHLSTLGFLEMSGVICVVLGCVFALYVHITDRTRRMVAGASALKIINRVCGTVLAGTAVAVATK